MIATVIKAWAFMIGQKGCNFLKRPLVLALTSAAIQNGIGRDLRGMTWVFCGWPFPGAM
jgi:hypothetical protein